jgi:hypothetical protein
MGKLNFALVATSCILVLLIVGCDSRRQGATAPSQIEGSGPRGNNAGNTGGPMGGDPGSIVEGTINGGGGRGMRCKSNGKETIESLDLFEARALGLVMLPVPSTEEAALDLAINVLAKHMRSPRMTISHEKYVEILKDHLKKKWLTKFRYLDATKSLRMINDSHEVIKQSGCEAVQIAVYYESTILIDKKLWDQLDNLSKAAVWLHELIYHMERQNGGTNSISTRILVGQLFSTQGSRPRMDGIPADEKNKVDCSIWDERLPLGSTVAYESKNDRGGSGTEIVFSELPNATAVLRLSAFFNHLSLTDLENPQEGQSFDADLDIDSLNEDRQIRIEATKDRNFTMTFSSRKTGKIKALKMECSKRSGHSAAPSPRPEKNELVSKVPVGPPVVPGEVEMKSRYDGVGTYETTATYNFRFMTHDVEITRNNWDVLFEARKDFRDDRFEVNTVTDDDSFIFEVKSGEGKCELADPCEVASHIRYAKENSGQMDTRQGHHRNAIVAKGRCYLVSSQDRDGSILVAFEVKEHTKAISTVIHKIKVISTAPTCEKP